MIKKGFDGFLRPILKWLFLIMVIVALTKLQSVFYVIPFLKIEKVEVEGADNRIESAIKRVVSEKYHGSYPLLLLDGEGFLKSIQKSTEFAVASVKIAEFVWLKGVLKLKVAVRKPLFLLNDSLFLGKDGVIFGFLKKRELPLIYDLRRSWRVGDIYDGPSVEKLEKLSQEIKIFRVDVLPSSAVIRGKVATVLVPSHDFSAEEVVNLLNNIRNATDGDYKILLSLYGEKSYSLKTFKE